MPPPLPRSSTCSPGSRLAMVTGSPQPSESSAVSAGKTGQLLLVIERRRRASAANRGAFGNPPVILAHCFVNLANFFADDIAAVIAGHRPLLPSLYDYAIRKTALLPLILPDFRIYGQRRACYTRAHERNARNHHRWRGHQRPFLRHPPRRSGLFAHHHRARAAAAYHRPCRRGHLVQSSPPSRSRAPAPGR